MKNRGKKSVAFIILFFVCVCIYIYIYIYDLNFEQLQHLTSTAGLVFLSQYFDGTCDCKVAAVPIIVGQMS